MQATCCAQQGKQYSQATIKQCMPDCSTKGYSLSIITPDYRCWCSISTPDAGAQEPESACSHNGHGAAVFFHHAAASAQHCRLAPIPFTPKHMQAVHNAQYVSYDDILQAMTVKMEGSSGTQVMVDGSSQLYGQVEVTAMVSSSPGILTAFQWLDADVPAMVESDPADGISFKFINDHPGAPNSIWIEAAGRGTRTSELLLMQSQYQKLLGLGSDSKTSNTLLVYTIFWQPHQIVWAVNGVPVFIRTSDSMKVAGGTKQVAGQNYTSPNRPCQISFSISAAAQGKNPFGGQLAATEPPYYSQFTDLRRIFCTKDTAGSDDEPSNAPRKGPAWLYMGAEWDWTSSKRQQKDASKEKVLAHQLLKPLPGPTKLLPGRYKGFTVVGS
eukprot:GHRR01027568.1.p1 GENE.GHRR01027568.1~~GHRR01027568.1.p1  ORF type:complete len:384 (+),score=143.66 GHRR01027568.1:742-1893(+)